MIELERINIFTKVLLLSSHVALHREGYFHAAVHAMAYVAQRYNSILMYDSSCQEIDHSFFKKYNWSEFYRNAKEAVSMNPLES